MQKNNEEELSLKDLILKGREWWQYLFSKWKPLVMIGLLGGALGLVYSFIKVPTYTANLTFALEEKSAGGGLSSIASQFGLSMGGGEGGAFTGDNILELLKSRYLIEKTLLTKVKLEGKEDLLLNRYIRFNELEEDWSESEDPALKELKYIDSKREAFSLKQDSVLGKIQKNIVEEFLSVSKIDKKLNIVSVSINSEDELFAKAFCEHLVKNVSEFYIETKTSKSKANIALLEYRVDSVRRELDKAMYGRAELGDQNMGLVRQRAAVPKIREEMRVQMLGTMYGELIKNLEFSKLALMREEPLIQIIDRPILPLEKDRLGKAKGIVLGGFLFGFFGMLYFIGRKVLEDVMAS